MDAFVFGTGFRLHQTLRLKHWLQNRFQDQQALADAHSA